jgi:ABC-2 type transport system permease protein
MNSAVSEGLQRETSMWSYVWKLLRMRMVITVSSFRRSRPRRKIGIIILGLVILGGFGLVFAGSWFLLRFLRGPELATYIGNVKPILDNMPILILAGAFLGILLTSFGVLLQALYLAGDMDFLLSAPVPMRAVFITKLLQAILPNLGLIGLFSLPVLYGLGVSGGYNIFYYPLVIVVLVSLALAAAGLSSLLVMGVVRIFPARRVAEVLAFIGATVSIICSQTGQFTNQMDFSNISQNQVNSGLTAINRFNTPWSPLAWAGRGLVDIGEGRWLTGLFFLVLTLGLAAGVFYFSLGIAERLYYNGWATMQVSSRRKRARHPEIPTATGRLSPSGAGTDAFPVSIPAKVVRSKGLGRVLLPPDVIAILRKDFLVLRRDLRNMSQMITPLIFGIIYAFALLRNGPEPPAGRGEAPEFFMTAFRSALVYANVGISLFVGWSLLTRLAMQGFSHEGKQYWILKSSPVSANKLLLAKFLVAFLPSVLLSLAFLILISLLQKASLGILLYGLPVVAFTIAGVTGLNLAFGVRGANLTWEDPRQMSRGTTGCLGSLVSLGFLALALFLFFAPPLLLPLIHVSEIVGQGLGLVMGSGLCLVATLLPPLLVRSRVSAIGES